MLCCGNCFGDAFLCRQIESRPGGKGSCGYCGSQDVPLVDPAELSDYFEILLGVYQASNAPTARGAYEVLSGDWLLFEDLERGAAESLLEVIFDGSDVVGLRYENEVVEDVNAIGEWDRFREELKHRNRYFPQNQLVTDRDRLSSLFGLTVSPNKFLDETFFRARVCEGLERFGVDEMGKPPPPVTSHGRANPFGIPYLYLASDQNTAVAEVRPSIGDLISVATFTVREPLSLADLRDPRKSISPFQLDEDRIRMLMRDRPYLSRLGDELSNPVLPRDAQLEYLPSQYLCEFIKHLGFDGVLYQSAVGKGFNVAVFSDSKIPVYEVEAVRINKVEVGYTLESGS